MSTVSSHAQGWRDQQDAQDQLRAAEGIVASLAWSALAWACLGLVAWMAMGLSGCGSADDAPAAPAKSSTCYRCSYANGALVQQSYSCTAQEAIQFGRSCYR